MKNLKKLGLMLMMVAAIFTLVGCSRSSISSLADTFEEKGYHMYEYKNYIAANFKLDSYLKDGETTTSDEETTDTGSTTIDRISDNLMLIPVDYMSLELRAFILHQHEIVDESALEKLTIDTYPELSKITDLNYNVYVFADYEVVDLDDNQTHTLSKTAVVIEFASQEYLREVLDVSTTMNDLFDSYESKLGKDIDIEDHINGNLLLLFPDSEDRLDFYDEIVGIFSQVEIEE